MRAKRPLAFLLVAVMAVAMFAAMPAAAHTGGSDHCNVNNEANSDRGSLSVIDRSGVEIGQNNFQFNDLDLNQNAQASAPGPGNDVAVAANSANVGQSNVAVQEAC